MLQSLALIVLVGLSLAAICQKFRLPRLIGMLATGILLGPFVLDMLDSSLLGISAELRKMALVIILIRAGLSLNLRDLKQVGRPAILLSFVPAGFEIMAYALLAPRLLGLGWEEAVVLGSVMGAVSPAVVVPQMVRLMEAGYGTSKSIPQLILAGASLDDVFCIVMFTTFVGIAQGGTASVLDFAAIPLSILSGLALGAMCGLAAARLFELCHRRKRTVRNSVKLLILLAISFLLLSAESWLEGVLPLSGLLAVMGMACVFQIGSAAAVTRRLSEKFSKLWIAAELLLFVLVGAAVDVRYALGTGLLSLAMIALALGARAVGVALCLLRTELNHRERLFCVIAYLPKATVQAAIGTIPLSLGLAGGQTILSVAVLGILITAPLGALGIERSHRVLLTRARGKSSGGA